jgi:glycosyltransferase involved in cell wall biosynthesis
MWVVGYVPGKLGSFERFMEVFARGCAGKGARVTFVFRGEPLPAFADALANAGAKVHVTPMRSRLDWRFILTLSRLIKAERVDILHSNFDLTNFNASLVAFWTQAPIYIWHQHNFMGRRFSLLRWAFLQFLCRKADRVLCVTDSMRSHLVNKGLSAEKVTRVYIGPDLALFAAAPVWRAKSLRQEFGFPESSQVIVCVSDARPEKGQLTLLQAFSKLLHHSPNARLLLIGGEDGRFSKRLQSEVDRLGITDRVRLTKIRNDVPRLLAEADVSVVPPKEEVSLLAIMESMAASKPVIATRVGGIPEVVADGLTGVLVPPGDVPALTAALISLLQNPWLADKLGKAGRRAVEEQFNTQVATSSMLNLYEELAAAHLR